MKGGGFQLAGKRWTVKVVSSKSKYLNQNGERYDGRCFFDKRRIYISKDLDDEERDATLLHEIVHVLVRESGAYEVLEAALPPGDAGRVDEAFVSVGSPHLYTVLKDLGFRFPRLTYS